MTKDNLIEALAQDLFDWNNDEDDWWSVPEESRQNYRAVITCGPLPLIVEFVADWVERNLRLCEDDARLPQAWREEMT